MKVLFLVGGMGIRLKPLTDKMPKSINAGIYIVEPTIFKEIAADCIVSFGREIYLKNMRKWMLLSYAAIV